MVLADAARWMRAWLAAAVVVVPAERMMLTFPTIVNRRLEEIAPDKKTLVEAWGFLLLGLGIYLALACYSFTPFDYGAAGVNARVSNFAGRFGAFAAAHVLGRFGIVGMVWPIVFLVWGALTATGFVVSPKPRRLLGFFVLTAVVAGFCEMLLPRSGLPEPSFGFGGIIGHVLRMSFKPQLGYGGTLVALFFFGAICLVLTGNLKIVKTADHVQMGVFHVRRFLRRHLPRLARQAWSVIWNRWILNKDPEELLEVAAAAPAAAAKAKYTATGESVDDAAARKKAAKAAAEAEAAKAKEEAGSSLDLDYDGPVHGRPEASLFMRSKKGADRSQEFKAVAQNLTGQLAEFKIMGEVVAATQGPVVTTFEFKPAPGTKVSKISALGEDLARLLKAQSLRVLAPIPGKDTVGFEVPNGERSIIGFADLIEAPDFKNPKKKLPIAMGVDIFGKPIIEDLAEMPHLLVAGSTGSGKSVFMNTLIGSLIARHSAKDLRFIMIDPKMVEMAAYNSLPHMARPVVTDAAADAKQVLNDVVSEMESRYQRMRAVGVRNIDGFNEAVKTRKKSEFLDFNGRWAPMPYLVLIIDEMADMMMLLGKDAEQPITRIAQKARAAGIHMVMATQRPSAEVVTGLIKANFPTRVAFRVLSGIDSRTILDQSGAETLLGKGDMLFLSSGGTQRLHGAFLSDGEVQSMVKATAKKK
jgi:S-DNA-T family DNA segregation ATPase FtsK/SpoIIIE